MSVVADVEVSAQIGQKVFDGCRIGEVCRLDGDAVILESGERLTTERFAEVALPPVGAPIRMVGCGDTMWVAALRIEGEHVVALVLDGDRAYERIATPTSVAVIAGETLPEQTCTLLARMHQDHRQWKQALTEDAHAYASDHDLCDVFDRFMEQHGLDGRTNDYDARIIVRLIDTREGKSFDDAFGNLTSVDVRALIATQDFDFEVEEDYC